MRAEHFGIPEDLIFYQSVPGGERRAPKYFYKEVIFMTVNQLSEQVLTLGFESVMEDSEAFINSANRALRQIFSELCYESKLQIISDNPRPCLLLKEYTHTPGDSHSIALHGRALCFKASGEGRFTIKTSFETIEESFSSPYTVIRKFIEDGATLTFHGALGYKIMDLVCSDDIRSSDESKIPVPSASVSYDISALVPDFLSISRPPTDKNGTSIEGSEVIGGRIFIPYSYSGEITVYYRRRPHTVYIDSEEDIDIPEESAWLLPLLVSAYLWLDDDGGKAQYYMQLYREGIAQIQTATPRFINLSYSDVLRWC